MTTTKRKLKQTIQNSDKKYPNKTKISHKCTHRTTNKKNKIKT